MTNRQDTERKFVLIVEPDVNIGIKLSDWLAGHGYQTALVRSVEAAIEELSDIRPQLVFVGGGHAEPTAQIEISEILRLIRIVSPGVPMITIAYQTNKNLTHAVFRQEAPHARIQRN
jgi:DNA-binding NtrC family response regulator